MLGHAPYYILRTRSVNAFFLLHFGDCSGAWIGRVWMEMFNHQSLAIGAKLVLAQWNGGDGPLPRLLSNSTYLRVLLLLLLSTGSNSITGSSTTGRTYSIVVRSCLLSVRSIFTFPPSLVVSWASSPCSTGPMTSRPLIFTSHSVEPQPSTLNPHTPPSSFNPCSTVTPFFVLVLYSKILISVPRYEILYATHYGILTCTYPLTITSHNSTTGQRRLQFGVPIWSVLDKVAPWAAMNPSFAVYGVCRLVNMVHGDTQPRAIRDEPIQYGSFFAPCHRLGSFFLSFFFFVSSFPFANLGPPRSIHCSSKSYETASTCMCAEKDNESYSARNKKIQGESENKAIPVAKKKYYATPCG